MDYQRSDRVGELLHEVIAELLRRTIRDTRLGKQLTLRFVPSIEFAYDETEEEAQRIESLLKMVKE